MVAIERGRSQHPRRTYLEFESPQGRLHAHYSTDSANAPVFAHEVAAREIVGTTGALRSPPVLAHGPLWMLAATIEPEPVTPEEFVDRVVAAAAEIPSLRLPSEPWPGGQGGRIVKLLRRARLLRSPVPVRDVLRARRLLANLQIPLVPIHGGYQRRHVFPAGGACWVIDWEQSGSGPIGFDLMHFWTSLDDPAHRDRLFAATLDLIGRRYEAELHRLRYAMLVRTIAGKFVDDFLFEEGHELLLLLPDVRAAAE